jgi:hypothetical protein
MLAYNRARLGRYRTIHSIINIFMLQMGVTKVLLYSSSWPDPGKLLLIRQTCIYVSYGIIMAFGTAQIFTLGVSQQNDHIQNREVSMSNIFARKR